jgi:hypothetical protein
MMSEAIIMKEVSNTELALLEDIVDRSGLANVLGGLAYIAREKADHLRSNWQDEKSARGWDQLAHVLDKTQDKVGSDV